jgi:glycine/D-amino acid oxidase-like deaminating enzyme
MPFTEQLHPHAQLALKDASPAVYWLDDARKPAPMDQLSGDTTSELTVIGAGFTGLWTALLAKETNPTRDVVLLEAGETAQGASGRNGGFVDASLTHGFKNGLAHWPTELATLLSLGHENLEAIEKAVLRYGIDCDFVQSGEIDVAIEPYQVEEQRRLYEQITQFDEKVKLLDRHQMRSLVNSPTYLGGLYKQNGVAIVNPARLAWGLRKACLDLGVRLYEHTPAIGLDADEKAINVKTPHGYVVSQRVVLATNAYPPLFKRLSFYILPIYDYALVTEPLSLGQREAIGWEGRQGMADSANQFHYYRMTEDGRILWGGYDARYFWNNGFGPQYEFNAETFNRLASNFFYTFPQLVGLRFTHCWAGAIDTCSRFTPFWGTLYDGRACYTLGFTGLGVGSSRFAAQVMLDLLDKNPTSRTKLEMVRTKPMPFPPEPLRSIVINLTRWSLHEADQNQGRRNIWLKILDQFGLGFDS